jgi:hypothetical protein
MPSKLKPWDVLLVIVIQFYFVTIKLKQGKVLSYTNKHNKNIEKTCECKPFYIAKMFEEEMNSPLKGKVKKQLAKK